MDVKPKLLIFFASDFMLGIKGLLPALKWRWLVASSLAIIGTSPRLFATAAASQMGITNEKKTLCILNKNKRYYMPHYKKTNNEAFVPSKYPDQTGFPRNLIRVFPDRIRKYVVMGYAVCAQPCFDQTCYIPHGLLART